MNTYGCALGVMRGMCTYLLVCSRGVEGYVCAGGVEGDVFTKSVEGDVCAGGVEGDVCIPMAVRWGKFK